MLTIAQNIVMQNTAFQKTLQMEKCKHELKRVKVLESTATCETTVLVCMECGQELEPPKTEC